MRVKAGLRNARAKGKKFGRPRALVDALRVAEMRRDGLSWSQVCRTLNVSKGSAQRRSHGWELSRVSESWPSCARPSVSNFPQAGFSGCDLKAVGMIV